MPQATQFRQARTAGTQAALVQLCAWLQAIYGPDVPRVVLYGSEARGFATEAADVDILLVYRHT